jgi:hypothetical protein
MRKHRLMLDYDDKTFEEVKADAEELVFLHHELGDFTISMSDQPNHWRVEFRKSELDWGTAIGIAEESECDKDWLDYCKKYECFAVKTVVSKNRQPRMVEVVNPPVGKVESPFSIIVTPIDSFNLRCCLRLCESIKDPEWVWTEYTPVLDMNTRVEIGCRDEPQAMRRLKWLSERIKGRFEVKKIE